MAEIRTFRDLIAWQRGMELAKVIYKTTASMPQSEQFGLMNQMRRAAVSIPSNIAEGYARGSLNDYLRFLRVARGSHAELSTQYELAVELGLLTMEERIKGIMEEADRVIQGLIRSLEKSAQA